MQAVLSYTVTSCHLGNKQIVMAFFATTMLPTAEYALLSIGSCYSITPSAEVTIGFAFMETSKLSENKCCYLSQIPNIYRKAYEN